MRQCLACGKETNFKYCNQACGDTYRRKKKADEKNQEKLSTDKSCKHCGKIISTLLRSSKIFCSVTCRNKSYKKEKRDITISKIREIRICVICKEEFEVINHRQRDNCSKSECKFLNQKNKSKLKYSLLTKEQKLSQRLERKYITLDLKEPTQDVICKCPICEIKHTHTFSPAWIGTGTPRVYCDSCNALERVRYHTSIFHDNRASL